MDAAVLEPQQSDDVPDVSIPFKGSIYVEGRTVNAKQLIDSPNVMPYWFDDENQRVIFVETPDDIDLSDTPFMAQSQYEHAQRLYAVTYQTFNRIAAQLPDPRHLILIYSTGRCGSTLLHQVLNAVDDVKSFSEPNMYAQAVSLRAADISRHAEILELMRSTTRIICRAPSPTWALKFHAQIIEIADVLHEAFPSSTAIFLYRNAESMLRSFIRSFLTEQDWYGLPLHHIQFSSDKIRYWSYQLSLLRPFVEDPESLSLTKFLAIWWLSPMQKYLELHPMGLWQCALRYEDLTENPQETITELFNRCDISTSKVDQALKAFEHDSQLGTRLSQDNVASRAKANEQFNEEVLTKTLAHLVEHPVLKTPNYILPDTLTRAAREKS